MGAGLILLEQHRKEKQYIGSAEYFYSFEKHFTLPYGKMLNIVLCSISMACDFNGADRHW